MNTAINFKRQSKDQLAVIAALICALIYIVAGLAAAQVHTKTHNAMPFITMDTVVVTAPRMAMGRIDAVVVAAPRLVDPAIDPLSRDTRLAHAHRVKSVMPL